MGNMFKCALKQGGSGGSGADLIVTCSAEFAGATITASKTGSTSQTQTCPSTSPYVVTFSGLDNGTWTVSGTISGQTYSVQATITDFSAILEFGFNWQEWVDSAQYLDSSDYNDLDEVLEDKEALRELFLEHNCVDYLADVSTASADVTKILNTDLAAKWINNSDYALDTLSANAEIKSVMDEADKYGYGEWVIVDNTTTPPTWGAKGCVPVMTSNSAPYGTASDNSHASQQEAYNAFDGDESTYWNANSITSNGYMQYKFVNPVCVKKIYISDGSINRLKTYKIQASNDGSTFTDITDTLTYDNNNRYVNIENDNYYLYYRLYVLTATTNITIATLQFYGRQLTVSVPVMTSNTAPFGEVSASGANSGYEAYKAFDGNTSTYWVYASSRGHIQYHFTKKVAIKKMVVKLGSGARFASYTLKGSNDGTNFTDLVSGTNSQTGVLTIEKDVPNDAEYEYLQLDITSNESAVGEIQELQFYGLDYSEKEFEQGTTKKWLYDHGVQIEPMSGANGSSGVAPVFGDDSVVTQGGSASSNAYSLVYNTTAFDLTPYNIMRAKILNQSGNRPYIATASTPTGSETVQRQQAVADMPNNLYLDMSSVDQSNYCIFNMGSGSNGICEWLEMWLEP